MIYLELLFNTFCFYAGIVESERLELLVAVHSLSEWSGAIFKFQIGHCR